MVFESLNNFFLGEAMPLQDGRITLTIYPFCFKKCFAPCVLTERSVLTIKEIRVLAARIIITKFFTAKKIVVLASSFPNSL